MRSLGIRQYERQCKNGWESFIPPIRHTLLRESDPEFHEFAVKTEISDFFISGQEKPFGDLFTKITTKLSKEFLFSRNSAKREMPYLLLSRHEILPRFGAFSKRSGRKTA